MSSYKVLSHFWGKLSKARTWLLTTTAGLVLVRAGGTGGRGTQPPATPATDNAPATVVTVMEEYNTAASQQLKRLEAEFNKDRPPATPAIVYLDYDQVATWYSMREGPSHLKEAIGDYLTAKTGHTYGAKILADVAKAMGGAQPAAFTPLGSGAGGCLVVPVFPGISFDSFYAASFQVGARNPLAGKIVLLNLSTPAFGDFANAHESWHCLDTRYHRDTGTPVGLAGAVKANRTEMFADLGGVMEGVKKGANLTLIDKVAAARATWVFLTGPARTQTPRGHEDHYKSIIYHTQPGLYALKARIQEMGIDHFRTLDHAQMRALAYAITEAHALTYTEAVGIQSSYTTGKAPAAVQPQVAQLKAIAAASVRPATPTESAAQKADAQDAEHGGGMTELALLTALKTRAGELGDATHLASQLQARQEMTDKLRAKLSSSPSTAPATEAQLKLLFYTDPHLSPRQDGASQGPMAD